MMISTSISFGEMAKVTVFNNNSNITDIESWYIPTDILRVVCTITSIIIAVILLAIIAFDKACHTVPMMLVANTCLAELVCVCIGLGLIAFTLENDLKRLQYQDSLCIFRGYLIYAITVIQNHSYNLQALYRYVTVVYPSRLFWQSCRFQMCLIILTWIFGFAAFLPFMFVGDVSYNAENQICQVPMRLSFTMIYCVVLIYVIPNIILNIIYLKLVRFVHEMNKRVTPANVISRAERELKMVRNIITITTILLILGFPYAMFILMSFFTSIPKYNFRVAYIFVDVSTTAVIIAVFKTTEPIKLAAKKAVVDGLASVMPITRK
jgi:hypothetical protein